MRFFSLIPAALLAVTGFASAAPPLDISRENSQVIARDDPIQATISIVNDAAGQLQPLSTQLSNVLAASPIDPDQLSSVLTGITSVITNTNSQLKVVVPNIDFTSPNASDVASPLSGLLNLIISILVKLIPGLKEVLSNVAYNLEVLIGNLLNGIRELATFLQPFGNQLLKGILTPIINVVENLLNELGNLLSLPIN